MPGKKQIRRGDKIGLKLTSAERTLLLEGLTCLPTQYEQAINGTPTSEPVMLTLDDLDDLGGYVAADANHATNKKLQKKLDAVFQKIQHLLETHTDDEPPKTVKIDDAKKPKKPKADPTTLIQFKISLLDIKPAIWRRIQVPNGTLADLHEYIQAAFGWENYHLHQFEIDGVEYGQPALAGDDFDMDFEDETDVLLSKLLPKSSRKARWIYEYDFGDGWRHEVLFEGFPPNDPKAKSPLCLEGERACPPEDCGGPWGYGDYLAAIADPQHEQHEEMLEWRGPFDPEAFDPRKATKEMRKVK